MVAVPSIGRASQVTPRRAAPEADATRDLYERYARADLRVLPPPARQPRGGRGRDAVDVPERLPRLQARRRPGVRVGLALQDRAERLPDAPALVVAPPPRRVARRSGRDPGHPSLARGRLGRADRAARGAAGPAEAAAARAAPARVAGPLVQGDRRGARADAGRRRDVALPCAALACRRTERRRGARARASSASCARAPTRARCSRWRRASSRSAAPRSAATVATVAATSVVASTPTARHAVEHAVAPAKPQHVAPAAHIAKPHVKQSVRRDLGARRPSRTRALRRRRAGSHEGLARSTSTCRTRRGPRRCRSVIARTRTRPLTPRCARSLRPRRLPRRRGDAADARADASTAPSPSSICRPPPQRRLLRPRRRAPASRRWHLLPGRHEEQEQQRERCERQPQPTSTDGARRRPRRRRRPQPPSRPSAGTAGAGRSAGAAPARPRRARRRCPRGSPRATSRRRKRARRARTGAAVSSRTADRPAGRPASRRSRCAGRSHRHRTRAACRRDACAGTGRRLAGPRRSRSRPPQVARGARLH